MANQDDNNKVKSGQEGTTGNDRGMQDKQHTASQQKADEKVDSKADEGGVGSRTNGIGDGGSSTQKQAAGSDGSGGKGSIAEGIEGAGGDSVKGAKKMGEN